MTFISQMCSLFNKVLISLQKNLTFGKARIFTFYVVVRSNGTPKDAPGGNIEDGVAHPMPIEVAEESL